MPADYKSLYTSLPSGAVAFSPTQLDTFGGSRESCQRKWWFKYSLRLKEPPRKATQMGTYLHEVIENRLQGKRAPAVPKEITPVEQATVTKLVAAAFIDGIVLQPEHLSVEYPFQDQLLKNIFVVGFIDMLIMPKGTPEVHDHKTTKSFKWALGPVRLARDRKMLIYAGVAARRHHKIYGEEPDNVVIRHNYFLKDPENPRVKAHQAVLSVDDVDKNWRAVRKDAQLMAELKPDNKRLWHTVQGADEVEGSRACNAYGGCPFREICSGRETITRYRARIERLINPKLIVTKERKSMATFAERMAEIAAKKKKKAAAATTVPPLAKVTTKPALPQPPPAPTKSKPITIEVKPITEMAPWASPKCAACGGKGISSSGKPCRICDSLAKKAGRQTSGDFNARMVEGSLMWDGGGGMAVVPDTPTKVEQPVPADPTKTTAVLVPKESPHVASTKKVTKKVGRPRKGLTILWGVYAARGQGAEVHIHTLLEDWGSQLAAALGKPSFWHIGTWDRRDALRRMDMAQALDKLGSATVIVPLTPGPDLGTLAGILCEHADVVYKPSGA